MDNLVPILLGVITLGVIVLIFLVLKSRPAQRDGEARSQLLIAELRQQVQRAQQQAQDEAVAKTDALGRVAAAEATTAATLKQLDEAAARYTGDLEQLKATFSKMSTDVLKGMAPDVTKEVATKVEPLITQISAALSTYRQTMQQSLQGQDQALAQVREQMSKITDTTTTLARSTNDFTAVLKSAQHRGRWGEQTLRRVVEVAGLSPHCDFNEQVSEDDSRPDLIVKLPDNRCIIIDSKVPEFDVVIANQAAPNRRELVKDHAVKLRKTLRDLAAKNYPATTQKHGTPFDHVILFLPAESLLSTALEGDNDLVLDAGKHGILIATPATLIAFLNAIHLTWQQHYQAENAGRIAAEATALYDRVSKFVEHVGKVRKGLHAAVESFNAAIGSYESRVRPQGELVRDLGGAASRDPLDVVAEISTDIRRLEGSVD